jgi:hypothetical protein
VALGSKPVLSRGIHHNLFLPPTVGDTLRFYGLMFNGQGTLRMDCVRALLPQQPAARERRQSTARAGVTASSLSLAAKELAHAGKLTVELELARDRPCAPCRAAALAITNPVELHLSILSGPHSC